MRRADPRQGIASGRNTIMRQPFPPQYPFDGHGDVIVILDDQHSAADGGRFGWHGASVLKAGAAGVVTWAKGLTNEKRAGRKTGPP
ncbi:hypothetical protein GCM10010991_12320 [Gemmobacter aquaticus]|uniref:Uncharacterized protein n=1 Tax=Gemmobacter aquaticus TaxID=490185 RepID=A0A918DCZ8_9RHOB|nr:hypothetical protein GCM10010991_12320 [Gemmobacter aquaticus]